MACLSWKKPRWLGRQPFQHRMVLQASASSGGWRFRGVAIERIHDQRTLPVPDDIFPWPDLTPRVVGFGGAPAWSIRPPGYLVGGPCCGGGGCRHRWRASTIQPQRGRGVAAAGLERVWPASLVRKPAIYQFGWRSFDALSPKQRLRHSSHALLLQLPLPEWYGFLANTLTVPELLQAMLAPVRHSARTPCDWGLIQPARAASWPCWDARS